MFSGILVSFAFAYCTYSATLTALIAVGNTIISKNGKYYITALTPCIYQLKILMFIS